MKVCQINIVYNSGSTGKIVHGIHNYLLAQGVDSYVFYGLGQKSLDKNVSRISSDELSFISGQLARILGLRFFCGFIPTIKLILRLQKIKPDVVHLHCLNCYYVNPTILLRFLAKRKVAVIVTNHADITFTANCDCAFDCDRWQRGCGLCPQNKGAWGSRFFDNSSLSWRMFYNAFKKVENLHITSVSGFTHKRALLSPFYSNYKSQSIILNGVDVNLFHYTRLNSDSLPYLLHVTPNISDSNKGFKYIKQIAELFPEYTIKVVGATKLTECPSNIEFLGKITNQDELVKIYSMAKMTLLASKQESFSLVCAESLCCGTPVVGFEAGAPETISIPEYSAFVKYGDIEQYKNIIIEFLSKEFDKEEISAVARKVYDSTNIHKQYLELYSTITAK